MLARPNVWYSSATVLALLLIVGFVHLLLSGGAWSGSITLSASSATAGTSVTCTLDAGATSSMSTISYLYFDDSRLIKEGGGPLTGSVTCPIPPEAIPGRH